MIAAVAEAVAGQAWSLVQLPSKSQGVPPQVLTPETRAMLIMHSMPDKEALPE